LLIPAAPSGYVWCVTADGHSALEVAIAGDCAWDGHAETTESSAHVALSADDDSCGLCLDLSTSHHWVNGRPRQDELTVSLLVNIAPAAAVAAVPVPAGDPNTHRVVDSPPRIPETILYHRTIVLLI
jgi:hypothetical protein